MKKTMPRKPTKKAEKKSPKPTQAKARMKPPDPAKCWGVYQTREGSNKGREFFYYAMWHKQAALGAGERRVRGTFIPDSASSTGDEGRKLREVERLCRIVHSTNPFGTISVAHILSVIQGTTPTAKRRRN